VTTTEPKRQPARTFSTAIANQVGVIQANLEAILDRNPDAPSEMRAALARVIGKCLPMSNLETLERLRTAYEPATVAVEVRFTEVDRNE
jgi:hypothetical protein